MITVFSFTRKGGVLCGRICGILREAGWRAEGISKYPEEGDAPLRQEIKTLAGELFPQREALIFVGAAGIAVRSVAGSVSAKDRDAAVLVVDDTGKYVIPLLSGHIGGANRLALFLAASLRAEPVLTTATDRNGIFAADSWAVAHFCQIPDAGEIKWISSALLKGEPVSLHCEAPVEGTLPEGLRISDEGETGIFIGDEPDGKWYSHTLRMVPKRIVLGLGCRKGLEPALLEAGTERFLSRAKIPWERVACIASIDLKKEETALLELSEKRRIPFFTFPAEELSGLEGEFSSSEFVRSVTGVDNVCERSAMAAARKLSGENGKLILPKTAGQGMTAAAVEMNWRCEF